MNVQICKELKEKIRSFNTLTDIMFNSDVDFQTQTSNEDNKNSLSDDYSTTSESSQSSSSLSKQSSNQSCNEKSVNKQNSSSQKENQKSQKRITSYATTQLSMQQAKQIRKENSLNNIRSFKEIENLEQLLNEKQGQLYSNAKIQSQMQQTHNIQNVEKDMNYLMFQQSSSLKEKLSELSQLDSIENNMLINNDSNDTCKLAENSKQQADSFRVITPSSNENTQESKYKRKKSRRHKRNFTQLGRKNNSEIDEINYNYNESQAKLRRGTSKQQSSSKNISTSKVGLKSTTEIRTSVEEMMSNVISAAFYLQNMTQVNQKDPRQSYLDQINQYGVKKNEDKFSQSKSHINDQNQFPRKNPSQFYQSSILKHLSFFQENKNPQSISPQFAQNIEQFLQSQNINNENFQTQKSGKVIIPPQSIQLQNSNAMLEKISKFIGMQTNYCSTLNQTSGTNIYDNINSNSQMDFFESMKNYKRFFPQNNFDQIANQIKIKQNENKKQKKAKTTNLIAGRNRRGNILSLQYQQRKSIFCSDLINRLKPDELNYDSYKPTFLSYGVSQKSDSIFPKNGFKKELYI